MLANFCCFFIVFTNRQKHHKFDSIFYIVHTEVNPMVIQDGLGDIQPKAAAAAVPVPGFVHPVEWREDLLQIFLGNVDAGVLYKENTVLQRHRNSGSHRRIGHGVSDHIGKHLLHEPPIARIVEGRLNVHVQFHLLVLHPATELLTGPLQHLADIQVGALQVEVAAAHPGRRQNLLYQRLHIIGGLQAPA